MRGMPYDCACRQDTCRTPQQIFFLAKSYTNSPLTRTHVQVGLIGLLPLGKWLRSSSVPSAEASSSRSPFPTRTHTHTQLSIQLMRLIFFFLENCSKDYSNKIYDWETEQASLQCALFLDPALPLSWTQRLDCASSCHGWPVHQPPSLYLHLVCLSRLYLYTSLSVFDRVYLLVFMHNVLHIHTHTHTFTHTHTHTHTHT